MIRLLLIGPKADDRAAELRRAAPGVEVHAARLPAAAVRAFAESPPDAVVYCWTEADGGLDIVADAISTRPLASLIPGIVVGGALESASATFEEDVGVDEIVSRIGDLLGVDPNELRAEKETPLEPLPAVSQRKTAPSIGKTGAAGIEEKLRQVRHEPYFAILEVESDAEPQQIRDAYHSLSRRFSRQELSEELCRRFASELDEIRDALDDAYAVLGDERFRDAFLR